MDKLLIQKARQTNLGQFLLSRNENLIRNGKRYKHAEHESLVFTENSYYWNARGEHGNAIDFMMSFYGMSFNAAVNELTVKEFAGQQKKEDLPLTTSAFSFRDIAICHDMRRTVAYLHKTRGIDYDILQKLIQEKYIFQEDETNNAIFPIYDEHRQPVGAEVCGTLSDKRFKGVKAGSKHGYGFNISVSEPLRYALFFESAIDLISFYELERTNGKTLTGCLLVSLAGVKESVVEHTLTVFKCPLDALQPVICVDSDVAGVTFTERLKTRLNGVRTRLPDSPYKDWNEQLKVRKARA